jgi:hypothetical protein
MSERDLTVLAGEVARPTPGGCVIRYRHRGQTCEVKCRDVFAVGTSLLFTIASDSSGEFAQLVSGASGRFGSLIYDNGGLQGSWFGDMPSWRRE